MVDSGKEAIAADARVLIDTYAGARTRGTTGELHRFRAVVCDESHNLKSPEAQQTKVPRQPRSIMGTMQSCRGSQMIDRRVLQ